MDNEQALGAFLAAMDTIGQLLDELKAHVDNCLALDRDYIDWGDVGTAVHITQVLADLLDFSFLRGVYSKCQGTEGEEPEPSVNELPEYDPTVDWGADEKSGEPQSSITVMIEQTLVGFVDIQTCDEAEALDIANHLYVVQGKELPDMDTCRDLVFTIAK